MRLLQAPNLIPFDNPNDIDNVKEEYEGYGSKIDSVYDGLHKKSSVIFNVSCETFFSPIIVDWRFFFLFSQPQPVVDGLKEAEKYGNNGDHLSGLTSAVVSVMSVVSNLVNKIVDVSCDKIVSANNLMSFVEFQAPINVAQSFVSSANKVLNQVGGKIVGLQK